MNDTMNIAKAKAGTKVIVTEDSIKNGYDYVEQHARKYLTVGMVYTILSVKIHDWYTEVTIQEFPNEVFNSVSFEDIPKSMDDRYTPDYYSEAHFKSMRHAMKIAEAHYLSDEVILSAIKYAQDNPNKSVAHIMVQALDDWDL